MYKITKREMVDTISIPIMTLSKNISLVHKVRLSKADLENKRDYYHKEFSYASKYSDVRSVTTVRLTHSSILAIEDKASDGYDSLIINTTNRDFIRKSLSKSKKILKTPELFIENPTNGGVIVNPKLKKDTVISFEPYKGKLVIVRPCVIAYDDNTQIEGVALCLNAKTLSYINIPSDTFKTMLKIIKKFDFHQAGLIAITYLHSAEIGNHEFTFSKSYLTEFDTDLAPVNTLTPSQATETSLANIKVKEFSNPINKGW